MKTKGIIVLEELNKPYSPEFKAALGSVVESIAKQANEKLEMQEALAKYLEAIKADYSKDNQDRNKLTDIQLEVQEKMTQDFNKGLSVEEGTVYFKVITRQGSSRSVHSFIVKEDGPKFKRGDILKAASWNAPAKNQARGNIFGEYKTLWTGAWYLR